MSRASFSFSSTICSLDSSTSMASTVSGSRPNDGRKSSVWHMVSRSTITSMGRPDGALKYICRSPLRLLNRRSGTQPLVVEVGRHVLAALGQAGEVHVLAAAQPGREIRAEHPDGQAAQQLQAQPGLGGGLGQSKGLGQRIVGRIRRLARLRGRPCPGLLSSSGAPAGK